MQKQSIIWLTLTLSVILTLVTACGPATSTSNPTTSVRHPIATVPAGENLYVLDGYAPLGTSSIGNQQIIAFHPGSTDPTTLITLPAGLTSQDHQRLYTATARDGQTTITIINTQTGATLHAFVIAGTYSIAEQDFTNAVSSPDGRWLALRQVEQPGNETTIALVDTQAQKLVKTIQLNGTFSLDAISPHGGMLYLLQYLNDGSGHYYVRAYDTDANKLIDGVIADKSELNDPRMVGAALTRQMAPDGSLAYTLYIDATRNIAFMHILPLADHPEPGGPNQLPVPQFARCIDLPVGKAADLLHYYTLALSSDGTALYAANGALGVVTEISLNNDEYNIFSDNIVHQNKFNPGTASIADKKRMLHNGAVLSGDGTILYFTGTHGIWAVNTVDLSVRGNYLTQEAPTSVGFSADSHTVYAVDPAHGITLLDATTGQAQQIIQGPVHAPWGIEWITD